MIVLGGGIEIRNKGENCFGELCEPEDLVYSVNSSTTNNTAALFYVEISHVIFNGAYSQGSVFRIPTSVNCLHQNLFFSVSAVVLCQEEWDSTSYFKPTKTEGGRCLQKLWCK